MLSLIFFPSIHWGQLPLTCIWNTRRERSCRFAVASIPEQNNLMVYSQADAWPCLLCPQKFQIQLESPLKAKGIAFPLKVEWHWFYVFLSPLLQPLQGHGASLELFMNVTSGFKINLFVSTSHILYLCESLCYSTLKLFFISVLQHGLLFDSWIGFRKTSLTPLCFAFLSSWHFLILPSFTSPSRPCNISNILFANV